MAKDYLMSSISLSRPSLLPHEAASRQSFIRKALVCLGASALVAVAAHFSVPVPFSPVPTTLQTFAVLLVGMVLGPVGGFSALALYLAEGASGLPVFSPHGPGGLMQLLGPTGGYLFSYPFAAALAGFWAKLFRRAASPFFSGLLAGLVALVPIFAIGALWLQHILHLNGGRAFTLGVAPFAVPELFKLVAAAAAYQALRPNRAR